MAPYETFDFERDGWLVIPVVLFLYILAMVAIACIRQLIRCVIKKHWFKDTILLLLLLPLVGWAQFEERIERHKAGQVDVPDSARFSVDPAVYDSILGRWDASKIQRERRFRGYPRTRLDSLEVRIDSLEAKIKRAHIVKKRSWSGDSLKISFGPED